MLYPNSSHKSANSAFKMLHIFNSVQFISVPQACPTLCDPMDCSLPGSSVHGIFQARILKWVAISFSRRSFRPRDRTRVSHIVGRRFTVWATIHWEEKGKTEDEMVRWHHWLNGNKFEQLYEIVKGREAWCAAVHGMEKSRIWLSDWTTTNLLW